MVLTRTCSTPEWPSLLANAMDHMEFTTGIDTTHTIPIRQTVIVTNIMTDAYVYESAAIGLCLDKLSVRAGKMSHGDLG